MKTGTKSILFGVHQLILHPITVWLAWRHLYGIPGWRETVCIIIHDWGYWGKRNMDDADGETHPALGAVIALGLFGPDYYELCLYHSRHYAKRFGETPSRLCWADKLSITYERWYTYLPRAIASGEIREYRINCDRTGLLPMSASNREWFAVISKKT